MFDIAVKPTYSWPVTVWMQLSGAWVSSEFTATFKRYEGGALASLSREAIERAEKSGGKVSANEIVLKDAIVGWSGLESEGQDVSFSQESLERLLKITPAREALMLVLVNTQSKAQEKN